MNHWSDHKRASIGKKPGRKTPAVLSALVVPLMATTFYAQVQPAPSAKKDPTETPSRTRRFLRPVSSPDISSDRRVTFRLRAPQATEVTFSGEFMSGSKPLIKDSDNVWSFTTDPLPPEIYGYNFTIDGIKTIDPSNPEVKTGSTAQTIQSLLEVPGETPAFYDARPVPHGEIRTEWYESKSLHATRRMTIYTPPGFDTSGRTHYPVLYLLHGANADEAAWAKLGRVNLILDNLLADKKIKPFLVVMPFGYGDPAGTEPFDGSFVGISNSFGKDLLGDVIPYVETRFPVYLDRDHRAIAGLSMGGVESLTIGLNHLELFSYVAGFSAAVRPADFPKDFATLIANPQQANKKLHLLWLGVGRQDNLLGATDSFSKFLDTAQIKHTYKTSDGAHTWIVWRRNLRDLAPLLF
jgi:enterochelin esterase-like enzyme